MFVLSPFFWGGGGGGSFFFTTHMFCFLRAEYILYIYRAYFYGSAVNKPSFYYYYYYCERFEPRSHFKRLSLTFRVNVALNRTVVVDSD